MYPDSKLYTYDKIKTILEHGIVAIALDFGSEDSGSIPDAPTKCVPNNC